jgi:hypothetical protein
MLRRVALVKTDVSDEGIASMIRVEQIIDLGTTLAVTIVPANVSTTPIHVTMKMAIRSSETSVLTRAARRSTTENLIPPSITLLL